MNSSRLLFIYLPIIANFIEGWRSNFLWLLIGPKNMFLIYSSSSSSKCADIADSCDSLVICPYQILLFVSPLDDIQCQHRVDEFKFFAGQPTLVCICIGAFRRVLLMSLFLILLHVLLRWFVRGEVSGHTTAVLQGVVFRICSKQHAASFYVTHLAFSSGVLSPSGATVLQYWHNYSLEEFSFYFILEIRLSFGH